LQGLLGKRLEQYRQGTELASKPLAPPSVKAPAEPAPDLLWERITDEPKPPPVPRRHRAWRFWFARRRPFPFLPQEDETDCGAAALAMVGRFHGRRLSVARLRDLAHVSATGASLLGLAQAAAAVGFQYRAVTTDFAHLAGLTLPAVAHWKGYHFLVVFEVSADKVVVGDPAVGLVTLGRQDFEASWTGKLLLLTPTERLRSQQAHPRGFVGLLPLLARPRSSFAWLLLTSLLMALLVLALPLVTQQLVDGVMLSRDARLVFTSFAVLVGLGLALMAAGLVWQGLLERLANRFSLELTTGWFGRLMQLPLGYFHSRPIGSSLVRLEASLENQQMARKALTTILDLVLCVSALGMMFCYHAILGLLALLGFAVLMAGLLFSFGSWQRREQLVWLHKTAAHSLGVESIQNQAAIKEATAEPAISGKVAEAAGAGSRPGPVVAGWAWGALLLVNAIILWYSAVLVLNMRLTVGQLLACQMLVLLAAVSILACVGRWSQVCTLVFLLQKLDEVHETPAEQEHPAEPLPPVRGLIQFEDVSFRYHPESPHVLSRINLVIQPGQIVALIGRSGAGKSTLAQLLERFFSPTEGTIRIDGFDLAGVDVRSLRSQVSVVRTEPALVTGTIRDYIALADPKADIQRVVDAARRAGAHDFIMALPQSYDTVIGPGGTRLSDGQNVHLFLARAFLKEPRLLILDDVLSFLEVEAERELIRQLRTEARGRTTVLISRRPLPPAYADFIVVMDAGQVVEMGSHAELVEQRGLYYYWTRT
jgi:ATP-binding cassette subfamily B protein